VSEVVQQLNLISFSDHVLSTLMADPKRLGRFGYVDRYLLHRNPFPKMQSKEDATPGDRQPPNFGRR